MRMVITSESAICFRRGRYLYLGFNSVVCINCNMVCSISVGSCPPLQKGKHYNRNLLFEFQLSETSVVTSSCTEVSYICKQLIKMGTLTILQ